MVPGYRHGGGAADLRDRFSGVGAGLHNRRGFMRTCHRPGCWRRMAYGWRRRRPGPWAKKQYVQPPYPESGYDG